MRTTIIRDAGLTVGLVPAGMRARSVWMRIYHATHITHEPSVLIIRGNSDARPCLRLP